jgi:hypothetical protein
MEKKVTGNQTRTKKKKKKKELRGKVIFVAKAEFE